MLPRQGPRSAEPAERASFGTLIQPRARGEGWERILVRVSVFSWITTPSEDVVLLPWQGWGFVRITWTPHFGAWKMEPDTSFPTATTGIYILIRACPRMANPFQIRATPHLPTSASQGRGPWFPWQVGVNLVNWV